MARFDPRGKVNRALLVGVPAYDFKQPDHPTGVSGDLKAVEHNLVGLERSLHEGGVFGEDGITVSRPRTVDEFDQQLHRAVDAADGLLLLYFSGHGAVPSTGDELWLLMRRARIVPGAEAVFLGAAPWKSVLAVLSGARAERVVVILDCCYAGNASAAWDALGTAQRRRISLLMSVQANNRIDAGGDDTPTPFTAHLVRFLGDGLGGEGGEVGFDDLAARLKGHMSTHYKTLREPPEDWEPQSRSATSGDDVLLAVPPLRPPDARPLPVEPDLVGCGGTGGRPAGGAGGLQNPKGGAPEGGPADGSADGSVGVPDGGSESGVPDGGSGSGAPDGGSGPGALGRLGALLGVSRLRPLTGRRLAAVIGVPVAIAGLVATGVVALDGEDRPPCTPPLELRLLTDPDLEATVRKATEAYLTSDENRTGNGCRRSGITVYSAGAASVISAFSRQSDPWQRPTGDENNPQRDIGPQPDIWIPASPASVERARPASSERVYAEMTADPEPFAYSPVVLAVPQNMAAEPLADRVGSLAALTDALKNRAPKAEMRRPDPENTDSGLLATVGLYGTGQRNPAAAEHGVAQPGPPSRTGGELLCTLPDDEAVDDRTAALVPEFLLRTAVGCHSTTRARRMAAYPVDVPGLSPTFVRVRWLGADADKAARDTEAERFRVWLTGREAAGKGAAKKAAPAAGGGLAVFGNDGFRTASGAHPPLGTPAGVSFGDFGALENPGLLAGPAAPAAMTAALKGYREANGPGRVLFLLDSSGSMGALWEGPGGAPGIIGQSLAGLGGSDEYGIWAVAAEPASGLPYSEVLAFGTHPREEAQRALAAARVKDQEADPYRALVAAVEDMKRHRPDDRRPQLIVYLTDDEDNNRMTEDGRLNGLLRSLGEAKIPVVMASLDSGGCDKGKPDEAVSEASGGRCLDTKGDLVARLRDEVARTGTGDEG
ncbi:substrate-binding domain-containing protein [Streptomyces sp. NPDC006326]|uniref:substrate-binding domain-containing protein n=1 Tax=Streptomyces sp. NPDC006326 TaxID=3156752 RepID=UPI0033A9DE5C